MPLGHMFTKKYVFGQHRIETIASNLPCSLGYEQTTIQGQIGPNPEKIPSTYLNTREVVYLFWKTPTTAEASFRAFSTRTSREREHEDDFVVKLRYFTLSKFHTTVYDYHIDYR